MRNEVASLGIGKSAFQIAKQKNHHVVRTLAEKVVGQQSALDAIVPYVQMHEAGLAPEGRPAGVFLLLGPTGTGKTRTVEALAEALHGSCRHMIRVDCGEFQMEHEVAKLIGAPPGYLGHRETQPILSQAKLNASTTDSSNLSIVLFDEVEKAAPALLRLLLGVLDKAILHLGDNTQVNFERSMIFLTSNLGARGMAQAVRTDFGFQSGVAKSVGELAGKLDRIATHAVRKRFPPEFVNRLDACITYRTLSADALASIVDLQIEELQRHIIMRLGGSAFRLDVARSGKRFLLERGTSEEYGARELKRTIHRHLMQPLAAMVASDRIPPGSTVRVAQASDGQRLRLSSVRSRLAAA